MLNAKSWVRTKTSGPPAVRMENGRPVLQYKMYPLTAPGIAFPGPDFIRQAQTLGDNELKTEGKTAATRKLVEHGFWLEYLYNCALYEPGFQLNIKFKTKPYSVNFIPGHIWGCDENQLGPRRRAKVMVIGKIPGKEEKKELQNLIGPPGIQLSSALVELGVEDWPGWYVTNVIKFPHPEPFAGGAAPAEWVKDCLPLLHQELRMVRPDYILCLGSETAKWLLGKTCNATSSAGQVFPINIPLHKDVLDEPVIHTAKMMVCVHPAAVLRSPDMYPQFLLGLKGFVDLIRGKPVGQDEQDIEHYIIDNAKDLRTLIDEIQKDPANASIAWDSEWHGDHPFEPNAYLRTIQFSWQPKKACCVVLRHAGGAPAFKPDINTAIKLLNKLGKRTRKWPARAIGHFFRADLPWLIHAGLDLRLEYDGPEDDPDTSKPGARYGWEKTVDEGGFDTSLAAHAHTEAGTSYKLEVLANHLLGVPRYDKTLYEWKVKYCKDNKLKSDDLEGYGECPAEILHPYAAYDADVTRRLFDYFNRPGGPLDVDRMGNNCREAFWIGQRASLAVLEMEMTGIKTDRQRAEEMTQLYKAAKTDLIAELRKRIRWPQFNPSSAVHCRELLFGIGYSGSTDKETGKTSVVSPKKAKLLNLEPIKTTGKRPKQWSDVVARNEQWKYQPCSDKEVLGILAAESEEAAMLRNIRFVDQLLKTSLRLPKKDKKKDIELRDDDGNLIYDKGLISSICCDGRIRTHLFQTKETGRFSSARPNLQSLCLDGDTECLTLNGWIKLRELVGNEKIAQYWPDDGVIDFVKPIDLIKQRFKGDMIHLRTPKKIDMLMTPDHRCLLRRRRNKSPYEIHAKDYKPHNYHVNAGNYVTGARSLDWAEVGWLCAVQADGSFVNGGGISFTFTKNRKKKRLEKILHKLDVHYRKHDNGRRTSFYVGLEFNRDRIERTKSVLTEAKCFGPWLLNYNLVTLELFAKEFFHWDGNYTRKSSYTSVVRENADWVQIVWSLTGRGAALRVTKRKHKNENWNDLYTVETSPKPKADFRVSDRLTKENVAWDDYVYCVTVPSSFIVIRRNGKVAVTGNSKRRETDYQNILGDKYQAPLRSIFVAFPGCVLIEADYSGAELYGVAIMSGCKLMIEHCQRGLLPEDHPDYYDIHSSIAVNTFKLDCEPSKKGLKSIGKQSLRIAAKTVVFGLMYGRGAVAIARAAKEEKVNITVDEAECIITAFYAMYPEVKLYMESCQGRVEIQRFICNCFGRYRRFQSTTERSVLSENKRAAMNYPIQSLVADAVSRALDYLYHYREQFSPDELDYRIILQIHDAVLLEVPIKFAERVYDEVLPRCMSEMVDVWPCDLDGKLLGWAKEPFHLGTEREVMIRWGEKIYEDEAIALGIPLRFAHKRKK